MGGKSDSENPLAFVVRSIDPSSSLLKNLGIVTEIPKNSILFPEKCMCSKQDGIDCRKHKYFLYLDPFLLAKTA